MINKRSQGFYAEQVFKTIAAEKSGKGAWENALALEKQFLEGIGLDPPATTSTTARASRPRIAPAAADVVRVSSRYGPASRRRRLENDARRRRRRRRHAAPSPDRARHAGPHRRRQDRLDRRRLDTRRLRHRPDSGKVYAFAILLNGRGVWDSSGHAFQDRLLRHST